MCWHHQYLTQLGGKTNIVKQSNKVLNLTLFKCKTYETYIELFYKYDMKAKNIFLYISAIIHHETKKIGHENNKYDQNLSY